MRRLDAFGQGQSQVRDPATEKTRGAEGHDGADATRLRQPRSIPRDRLEEERPRAPQPTRRQSVTRRLLLLGTGTRQAATRSVAAALIVGALATAAWADTRVDRPMPLKPVALQAAQQKQLGESGQRLSTLRTRSDLDGHLERAGMINPFITSIRIPDAGNPLAADVRAFVWRMIARSMHSAENAPDLTNLVPTTPVKAELLWKPSIKDPAGSEIDVLPRLFPQLAQADGELDTDKLTRLFGRVNNPAPSADEKEAFLAANSGFKNGRAAYFPLDPIGPEPVQPHVNGTLTLPQLVIDVNGKKTVFTIGALCYKGGGPSFTPDGSWGGYDYAAERKKTPLNYELRGPIYSGNTSFGLFAWESSSKTNEYGWKLLDRGAYAGVTIAHFKLGELVDYKLDKDGKPTGSPIPITIKELQDSGRVSKTIVPSLQWRAFATEYRLSAFKSPDQGILVLDHMRALFARDAIFDYIANLQDTTFVESWQKAVEAATRGQPAGVEQMEQLWRRAITGLNQEIADGKHAITSPVTLDGDGVARITAADYAREAVRRSARNVVVLHDLGLDHNSIMAGGDNVNAAWQMVDLDDVNPSAQRAATPKEHPNVSEFTANLEEMISDLEGRVPELRPFKGQMKDLLLRMIERESPNYANPNDNRS